MKNITEYLQFNEAQDVKLEVLSNLWVNCLKPLQGTTLPNILDISSIESSINKLVKKQYEQSLDDESKEILQQRINSSIAPKIIETAVICSMDKYIDSNPSSTDNRTIKVVSDKTFDFVYTDGSNTVNFEVKAAQNFKNAKFNSTGQRDGVDYLIYVEYSISGANIVIESIELLTPSKQQLSDKQLNVRAVDRKNGISGKGSKKLYEDSWAKQVKSGSLNIDISGYFPYTFKKLLQNNINSGITWKDVLPIVNDKYKKAFEGHCQFITSNWLNELTDKLISTGKISSKELQNNKDNINNLSSDDISFCYKMKDICKFVGDL